MEDSTFQKGDDAMTTVMTPSTITDGQIQKIVNLVRVQIEKHRYEFSSEAVQQVLGTDIGNAMFTMFRERIEAVSNLITRTVTVNPALVGRKALDATGRTVYSDSGVVMEIMPKAPSKTAELIFFKLGKFVTVDELDKEYARRGLKPADPHTLAAFNAANPTFADDRPHATQWRDSDGKACCADFRRRNGERRVNVYRRNFEWSDCWSFAGVRND